MSSNITCGRIVPDQSTQSRGLGVPSQLYYALPSMGVTYFAIAVSVIQGVYAKHFGLALSSIATVLLLARCFDVITDPLVGYLSDRYHARTGSRKWFIALGGISLIFSGYFLFVPVAPDSVDAATQVDTLYFAVCYFAFYLSLTLFVIPHGAWGVELAKTGDEKTSLFTFVALFIYIGSALFFVVPLLPWFETTAITPHTLQWAALASIVLVVPSLYLCLRWVPDAPARTLTAVLQTSPDGSSTFHWPSMVSFMTGNKPLLYFLLISLLLGLALGVFTSMNYIFVDGYLGMGESFALLSLLILVVAACSLKFWYWLTMRHGKRLVWGLGAAISMVGMLAMLSLRPEETSFFSNYCLLMRLCLLVWAVPI